MSVDTKKRVDDVETHQRELARFMTSPLGERLITHLSLRYNTLHQEAEREGLTSEQKAFLIERAAGIKSVIDDLQSPGALIDGGYFEEYLEPRQD